MAVAIIIITELLWQLQDALTGLLGAEYIHSVITKCAYCTMSDLFNALIIVGISCSLRLNLHHLPLSPQEYISELVQLQDNVPGFSGARALEIVEEELGRPISEVFESFDAKPLAAASLGQVSASLMEIEAPGVICDIFFHNEREPISEVFESSDEASSGGEPWPGEHELYKTEVYCI